ncbi:MAG TPA: AAA family ATPase [Solirubrobacterales bacterium]
MAPAPEPPTAPEQASAAEQAPAAEAPVRREGPEPVRDEAPEPAREQAPEPVREQAPAPEPAAEEPRAAEPEPAPAQPAPERKPAPEPVADQLRQAEESATEPQVRAATPAAPARTAADEAEEQRLTAQEALAPRRKPGGWVDPVAAAANPEPRRMKVISFANQKGGVAKTTTTLNLAVAFAESGHRVLCVDLDPQGNLTMSQGIDPDKVEKSMYDVLVHRIPIREVIMEREVDVAVASIDLAGAEIAMSTQIGRERALEKALKDVQDDYDFVCIDTPPSLGLLTVNALTASDKVIVPVQCEYLSMRGLVQLQNTLEMIRENLNPRVEIEGILPTMLDSRTVHAKEAIEILEENFGELVFKSRIKKAIKFAEAPVRGSSVLKYDPKSNAADYYRELAKEVLTNGGS